MIEGNTISSLIGGSLLAISLDASLPILEIFLLRSLHPPAAVVALIVVLGHIMHYRYASSR
jgi:CBS domain-containing membrane protein